MNEDAAGHWWLISVILATQETDQEYHSLKLAQPYLETTQYKTGGGVTQVVECLPSKHEPLSSVPSKKKTIK
jgi:hypothetical protein